MNNPHLKLYSDYLISFRFRRYPSPKTSTCAGCGCANITIGKRDPSSETNGILGRVYK